MEQNLFLVERAAGCPDFQKIISEQCGYALRRLAYLRLQKPLLQRL